MPGEGRDSGGWFRLHRKALTDKDVFWQENRPRTKWEAWVDLIAKAAYRDHKVSFDGQVIEVYQGEVPTSERRLMEAWNWKSRGKVRRFLSDLQEMGRIERYTSHARNRGSADHETDHAQEGAKACATTDCGHGKTENGTTKRTTRGPRSAQKTDRKTDHGLTIVRLCNYDRYQGEGSENGTTKRTTLKAENGPNRRRGSVSKKKHTSGLDEAWERWWQTYPKRKGSNPKSKAREKWERAQRDHGVSPEELQGAAEKFRAFHDAEGTAGTRFVPMATTWLNQRRWEDELELDDGDGNSWIDDLTDEHFGT